MTLDNETGSKDSQFISNLSVSIFVLSYFLKYGLNASGARVVSIRKFYARGFCHAQKFHK